MSKVARVVSRDVPPPQSWSLLDSNLKDTKHVFHGTSRQAALKAARRGYTNICLRRRGGRRDDRSRANPDIRCYRGSRRKVPAPPLPRFEGVKHIYEAKVKYVPKKNLKKQKHGTIFNAAHVQEDCVAHVKRHRVKSHTRKTKGGKRRRVKGHTVPRHSYWLDKPECSEAERRRWKAGMAGPL